MTLTRFAGPLLSLLLLSGLTACGPAEGEPPLPAPDAGVVTPEPDAGYVIPPDEQARLDTVKAWADLLVSEEWTPGIAVAIVRPHADHFVIRGTLTEAGDTQQVDAQTLFEVGSVSKTFTSTLLAQLVVEGAVTLQSPAEALLPDGYSFPKGAGGEEVTLEHLATHRSGLPREPEALRTADPGQPYGNATEDELFAHLGTTALASQPGTQWAYSNLGAGVLGHLVTRAASRSSYELLLTERVLLPLGMTRTYVSPAPTANVATGYSESGEVPPINFSILHGAGAITSSASDLAKYVRAQWDAMEGRDDALPAGFGDPLRLSHLRHAATPVAGYDMGLGWFRGWTNSAQLPSATNVVSHGGVTHGFRAMALISPDDDLGLVILTNSTTVPDEALASSVVRLWRGENPTFTLRPTLSVPEDTLERYVGRYRMSNGFGLDVTREAARLYVRGTGQPRLRVYAHELNAFHSRVVDASFVFNEDAGGEITSLTLHQNGGVHQAQRVP